MKGVAQSPKSIKKLWMKGEAQSPKSNEKLWMKRGAQTKKSIQKFKVMGEAKSPNPAVSCKGGKRIVLAPFAESSLF